jgi:magnesium and cobalt transporter
MRERRQSVFKKVRGILGKLLTRRGESVRKTITSLIQESPKEESSLNEEERILLSNTLSLRDLTVDDVMIPRADIVAIPHDIPFKELTKLISEKPFTRFPVYHTTLDDVLGYIHAKDIAIWSKTKDFDVRKILQQVLFVPPSMRLLDLLLQMRSTQIPMALIVDEYGGIDGLVTSWDIIREVLGDLQDGHTPEISAQLTRENSRTYVVDARLLIQDLEEEIGAILTDEERGEDIDTVGGLVMYITGRVPGQKEVIKHNSGVLFEILDASPRRVTKVRIKLPPR